MPIELHVVVSNIKGHPAIEIRKKSTDHEFIKKIVESAMSETPLLIYPRFYNKLPSISSLVEKKIIKYNNEMREWQFII